MQANTVLSLLLLRWVYSRFVVVHGLNVAGIPLQAPTWSPEGLSPLEVTIRPTTKTFQKRFGTSFYKILPTYKPRNLFTRLSSKTDYYDGNNSDSVGGSDDTDNESSRTNLVLRTNDNATAVIDQQEGNLISDFLYGAKYVNSQYLSILWRYSILRSFAVTLPIGIGLWINQERGLYDAMFRVLRSILSVSSVAARLLQLPLEFAQSLILNMWNVSPEALAAAISFLPNSLAIPVVQLLLLMRTVVITLVDACCGNSVITFLSSMMAILVWRPAVEEWQYRSVLNKLSFGIPRWALARGRELRPSAIDMMQRINSIVANFTDKTRISNNETSTSSDVSTASLQPKPEISITKETIPVNETDENSTIIAISDSSEGEEVAYDPFLPDESTRILLGSLLFATTRLGWLSSDPADTISLSNSPYGFTIGFLQSIWSLVATGGGVTEVRHGLRIFILLLAIHQTVSSFLVAQHVFAGIYRQRGLAASVGAHVSWTVGKGTIVFRLLWKVWQSTYAGVWSTSYGSNPDSNGENDDMDANASLDDDDSK